MTSSSLGNCYQAYVVTTTRIDLYLIADTGSIGYTALGAQFTVSALSAGNTVTLTANGTTLELFVNGVSQGTRTDSTYSTGQPGCGSSDPGATLDGFTASDL